MPTPSQSGALNDIGAVDTPTPEPLWVTAMEVLIEGLLYAALAIVGITLLVQIT